MKKNSRVRVCFWYKYLIHVQSCTNTAKDVEGTGGWAISIPSASLSANPTLEPNRLFPEHRLQIPTPHAFALPALSTWDILSPLFLLNPSSYSKTLRVFLWFLSYFCFILVTCIVDISSSLKVGCVSSGTIFFLILELTVGLAQRPAQTRCSLGRCLWNWKPGF